MPCYRADDAEADEDGGGGDEINENIIGPREMRKGRLFLGGLCSILLTIIAIRCFWKKEKLEKEYPQQILQNAQSIHIKCPMREIDNHFENEVMHNDSSYEQIVVKLKDYNWCKAHSNQLSYILGMVIIVILIISGATIGARYYVEQREMAQLKADSIESIRKARLEKAINEITNRMDSLDRHFNRESEKLFNAVKGRKGKEK